MTTGRVVLIGLGLMAAYTLYKKYANQQSNPVSQQSMKIAEQVDNTQCSTKTAPVKMVSGNITTTGAETVSGNSSTSGNVFTTGAYMVAG